jgi:hypothetical protein
MSGKDQSYSCMYDMLGCCCYTNIYIASILFRLKMLGQTLSLKFYWLSPISKPRT